MTDIVLAFSGTTQAVQSLNAWDWEKYPFTLLVSFFYLKAFESGCTVKPKRLVLDSGAFSAWNANKEIDIEALTKEASNLKWTEAISLDVVGDPVKTLENTLWMNNNGAPNAYPVFHIGEPWEYLEEYCKRFPKIGLSCRFGEPIKDSLKWTEQCFARAYPHKFHSFGWIAKSLLNNFPFHSADSSSWATGPLAWGQWKSYKTRPNLRGDVSLLNEMRWYWDYRQQLQHKWKKELSRWKN